MRRPIILLGIITAVAASSLGVALAPSGMRAGSPAKPKLAAGLHKIKHVVVIMQENRSFDHYFGTYPGVDGIPDNVCVPNPKDGGCVAPFHNPADVNGGGPHGARNVIADVNGGKMDGFVGQSQQDFFQCAGTLDPECTNSPSPDVMGWHDAREIPNYWAYADNFVLQDHMFQPDSSWSF